MQILVINGSPVGKGNTFRVVKQLEQAVTKRDEHIQFNYIHLKDYGLEPCRGCYRCLLDGEGKCPIHDGREKLEEMMKSADGVIFATPVYVMNVSGLFKNFLDRYAYICHRPRFHGKKAWIISSTGALGEGMVTQMVGMNVATWGFEVAGRLGVIMSKGITKEVADLQWKKVECQVEKMAEKMVKQLKEKKNDKVSFFKLWAFKSQKKSFGSGDKTKADYQYWKSKGWLEPKCQFFTEAKVNPLANILANILARVMKK